MSEQSISIPLATQISLRMEDISLDTSGNPILPMGATQAIRHAQNKPRFTEFECTHHEVFRYAALVTDAVIPKAFWGSAQNYSLVMKSSLGSTPFYYL